MITIITSMMIILIISFFVEKNDYCYSYFCKTQHKTLLINSSCYIFHPSINNYFCIYRQQSFTRVGYGSISQHKYACLKIKAKKITKIMKILACFIKKS